MRMKIWFFPWTRYWKPEDIIGQDENGHSIIREGAEPFTHSGWSCGYTMEFNGKKYGQWCQHSEFVEGLIASVPINKYFYKEAPHILYKCAKDTLSILESKNA